ncbi:BTB/POZ domain-containing protein At1g04390 isoform X2 [Prosopis cineraria]|uniref:BTB/POZ domain-containing protein At1g04390 isoform X2 n=1 Tax=Prosopis cineraria TaxID=364024 RepID=UPI00240F1FC6|nr:BTB/POZ domain-containing protein At1g04390 isoform X2 [Prosopis cineraria]
MKSRGDKDKNRGVSLQINNLHQRFLYALNLGTRYFDEKTNKWKWQSANIEVQKQVIRSIDVFLDFISGDARSAHHTIVKDSVADILGAFLWILQCKNRHLLFMAANVAVNCAKAVWEVLKQTECVIHIVDNIHKFLGDEIPMKIEYFEQMSSLLGSILLWWPPTRFPVWNDVKLTNSLSDMYARTDISTKLVILKLYTSLALCSSVAKKLIDNGEVFLKMVVLSMGKSYPDAVRIEGFRLAQCLLRSQENCLKVIDTCGEALIDAIVCGMEETGAHSRKFVNKNSSILVEACRLALVTRWAGDHHISFWKQRIDRVLLNLLMENIQDLSKERVLSLDKQISIAKECLKTNHQLSVRGYVWDILGWLTIHSGEYFNPCTHGSELYINLIIISACLTFDNVVKKWCQIYRKDVDDSFQSEPASRAVLMMIYSPCKYISSQARLIFSKTCSSDHFTKLVHTLEYTSSLESYGSFDKLQLVINLIGLISFLSLPSHHTLESKHWKTVSFIVKRCLGNHIDVSRLSLAPHLHTTLYEKSCCWMDAEDWEGSNILLFYGLWGLAEMVHQSASSQNNSHISIVDIEYFKAQLVSKFLEICSNASFSHGSRWYATYILSHFGFYGFPNELAKRVGRCLNEKEYADIQLFVANGNTLSVHGLVLAVRCSSLLPPEVLIVKEKRIDDQPIREVRLSSHVDYEALVKLLEYVYVGYFQADEETVKKLKVLAKRCNLQPLLHMLHRQSPKWGTSFPNFDLTLSLVSTGSCFWDVILESKPDKLERWTCCICSHSVPHLHVHKVVLQSGCDYLQGLFRSGMKESHSQIIKVPISWEATAKLAHWFYSNELPNPPFGCLWDNMDDEQKLLSLQPYVELYWLSEFWILEDVQEACWKVIVSCLDSAKQLSIKILKMAWNLSLWKLVGLTVNHLAPLYGQLRDSCELDDLDAAAVHLICSASTQLSQNG